MTARYFDFLKSHLNGNEFLAAFAYGSGVFRQSLSHNSNTNKRKMIDFLVVVDDGKLTDWHENNLRLNPKDYPSLSRVALNSTNLFNDSVFYVPSVQVAGNQKIKYGVVGWNTLIKDLYTWEFMFLAGRLHKPTLLECNESCDSLIGKQLSAAMQFNYDAALNTALLLESDPTADFKRILKRIVGLSYTKDPRLLLAESPHKIENIVTGQFRELEEIYLARWEAASEYRKMIRNPLVRVKIINNNLPYALKAQLTTSSSASAKEVNEAVGGMVRRSAWRQMFLGAISTAPTKSIEYVLSKMQKRFNI